MKKISVVIPTYNEKENIPLVYERVVNVLSKMEYIYEIIFIDNFSMDGSRDQIRILCSKDSNVKAILNAKNFGWTRSSFYGLTQADGDAVVLLVADLQDPPELIPEFIMKWEKGAKIVSGIKSRSKENKLMYGIRQLFYRFMKTISDVEHIQQFTGFGLYDREFIDVLRGLDDPLPYLRGIVAELGFCREEITFQQDIRRHGKSSFKFMNLYDMAMLGITSYSKVLLRLSTLFGFGLSCISVIIAIITFIRKLVDWDGIPIGTASLVVGFFFIASVQLFFIGLLGEYILNMNIRIMKRPLVIEEERRGFSKEE